MNVMPLEAIIYLYILISYKSSLINIVIRIRTGRLGVNIQQEGELSFLHGDKTGCRAHPAFYQMCRGLCPGSKAPGADHSGRAVKGMNRHCPLEHWDCGFEFHLRHGCLCAFIPCLCCSMCSSGLVTGCSPVSGVLPTGYTNSVALVCKRTIPTERPPLVGEVSANFSG
jgi:hypothetical protein